MGNLLETPVTEKEFDYGTFPGLEYCVGEMQGWRLKMEDKHIACAIGNSSTSHSFAVLDGHGGAAVAEFASINLPKILAKSDSRSSLNTVLSRAFEEVDTRLLKVNVGNEEGCTAVCVVLDGTHLVCANAGDSRAILVRKNGEVIALSTDHKPADKWEKNRILAAGGTVDLMGPQYRVCGNLNLSRALGDLKYKRNPTYGPEGQIISATPDITAINLTPEDDFIFLACDGIWDVLTSREAGLLMRDLLRSSRNATRKKPVSRKEIMETTITKLLDRCLSPSANEQGGIDNMTAVLVDIQLFWYKVVDTVAGCCIRVKVPTTVKVSQCTVSTSPTEALVESFLGSVHIALPRRRNCEGTYCVHRIQRCSLRGELNIYCT